MDLPLHSSADGPGVSGLEEDLVMRCRSIRHALFRCRLLLLTSHRDPSTGCWLFHRAGDKLVSQRGGISLGGI
jgi:hypothetical protein